MKAASLILKIVAVLAAAFCVYAWLDTRGKISEAMTNMKGVAGQSLSEKSGKVPGILSDLAKAKEKNTAFEGRVRTLEQRNNSINAELETERAKSIQANSEVVKKNAEIRNLNSSVASLTKQVGEKDSLIANLKREILESKKLVAQNNETDSFKEKIASLENQLEAKNRELEEANKKAKLLELAEIVEVIETDAEGNKVRRKTVKMPYIPSGDVATVLGVNQKDKMVTINRGTKAGVKPDQKINLKREGQLVSEIIIIEAAEEISVGLMNRNVAFPETIEEGDLLELASPVLPDPVKEKAPAAEQTENKSA